MFSVTLIQLGVLLTLFRAQKPLSPTAIGHNMNDIYENASGNLSKVLPEMVKVGMITRHRINARKVTYGLHDWDHLPAVIIKEGRGRKPKKGRDLDAYINDIFWSPKMSVEQHSFSRTRAFSWRQSSSFKFFATTRASQHPGTMQPYGNFVSTAIPEEGVKLYGFESAEARDAFVGATGGIVVED